VKLSKNRNFFCLIRQFILLRISCEIFKAVSLILFEWPSKEQPLAGINVSKFKHDYLPLDNDVTKALEPFYTDLSSRELLERCKGGNTQNNNESYNGLLWHFAPKHLHNGMKTIKLANFLAVSIFNDGFYSILKMLQVMDVIIGPIAKEYAIERDDSRINQAELRHEVSSKEGRTARRQALVSQQALFEEEEGPLYGPGIAD